MKFSKYIFTPGFGLVQVTIAVLAFLFGYFFLMAGNAQIAIGLYSLSPAVFLLSIAIGYLKFTRYKNFNDR